MYSFRLTATNINTAEDLNVIQFAVKRHPTNHSLCKKAKKGGGGGRKSKDGNKGSVRELNCTAKAGNNTKSRFAFRTVDLSRESRVVPPTLRFSRQRIEIIFLRTLPTAKIKIREK